MGAHIIIHTQVGKKLCYNWILFLPLKVQSNVDSGKQGLEAVWAEHTEPLL